MRVVLHNFDNCCNTELKIKERFEESDVWLLFTSRDLKSNGKIQKMIDKNYRIKKVVCEKGHNMADYKMACVVGGNCCNLNFLKFHILKTFYV